MKCAHFLYGSTNGRQSRGAGQACGGRDAADGIRRRAMIVAPRCLYLSIVLATLRERSDKNMQKKVEFYLL